MRLQAFALAAVVTMVPALAASVPTTLPIVFEDHGDRFVARNGGWVATLTAAEATLRPAGVRMRWIGAQDSVPEGESLLPGKVHYFSGRDESGWQAGIATFGQVRFRDVYPETDLLYHASAGELEYDVLVRPGGDPGSLRLRIDGALSVRVDDAGNLIVNSREGILVKRKPVARQDGREIPVSFLLRDNVVGFAVGAYDRHRELVIDPVVVFSARFGGTGTEPIFANSSQQKFGGVAVDPLGFIYVTGTTTSADLPTRSGPLSFKPSLGAAVFVAKFDPSGVNLIYTAYLDGLGNDRGFDVAVSQGEAIVVGRTLSTNFPIVNALQTQLGAGEDGFISRLSGDGSRLIFSTYFGGRTQADDVYQVAVAGDGDLIISGETQATDLPVVNAFQATRPGGNYDSFIGRLSPDARDIRFLTYVGGNQGDDIEAIALGRDGTVYAAGYTNSPNLPVRNPTQASAGGGSGGVAEGFLLCLRPTGELVSLTYFGGAGNEAITGLALRSDGNLIVGGFTNSPNLPVSVDAFQRTYGGGAADGFLGIWSPELAALVYLSYVGGPGSEAVLGVGAGLLGSTSFTGAASMEPTFATAQPLGPLGGASDGFAATLDSGGRVQWGIRFGGTGDELPLDMSVDATGNLFVYGVTSSSTFPLAGGGSGSGLGTDAFLVKLGEPLLASVSAAAPSYGPVALDSIVSGFSATGVQAMIQAPSVPLPTTLDGRRVVVTDARNQSRDAGLYLIGPAQVNFVVPPDLADGPAAARLMQGDQVLAQSPILLRSVAPGIFTGNQNGEGAPAAIVLHQKTGGGSTQHFSFECGATPGGCQPTDIVIADGERVFLLLFGTGFRRATTVTATVDGAAVPVIGWAKQSEYPGLDQLNLELPVSLRGAGTVDVRIVADGWAANPVRITLK